MESSGGASTLTITLVTEEDMGVYTCRSSSSIFVNYHHHHRIHDHHQSHGHKTSFSIFRVNQPGDSSISKDYIIETRGILISKSTMSHWWDGMGWMWGTMADFCRAACLTQQGAIFIGFYFQPQLWSQYSSVLPVERFAVSDTLIVDWTFWYSLCLGDFKFNFIQFKLYVIFYMFNLI